MQNVLNTLTFSIYVVFMLFSPAKGYTQQGDGDHDATKKIPLEVLVTDMENNPRQGEKIIFIHNETKTEYRGVTNSSGKFMIHLPGATEYEVKVKTLGESQDYQTLEIPALSEGQVYDKSLYTIKYRPAQVFTLDNVYFDVDKATLREQSYKELDVLKEYLERRENIIVEISGHTDNTGNNEHNLRLSEQRARKVKQYLTGRGIDPARIKTKGYGESDPVATNETEEGRQKNRRTEVRIISE
ncbi:MAG: OmpA family protein [Bacteroidales bacterium]